MFRRIKIKTLIFNLITISFYVLFVIEINRNEKCKLINLFTEIFIIVNKMVEKLIESPPRQTEENEILHFSCRKCRLALFKPEDL